jgi:acetate kinase
MKIILTINSGSTSVKLGRYEHSCAGTVNCVATEHHQGHDLNAAVMLAQFAAKLASAPQTIAHRVVHGGTRFVRPVRVDDEVIAGIEQLSSLAPLHNPVALRWLKAAAHQWPNVPQVAVFDTAFFAKLPRVAAEYAVAAQLRVEQGVRRYGFHGLAHEFMWQAWCGLRPDLPGGGRLITLQLGGGCSIAALRCGQPLDTSMGFSPLEGLMMASRCGDIDAAVVPYLQHRLGLSGDEVVARLNEQAGLAGVSTKQGNPQELLADPAPEAQFAVELYCYRIRKYIGAYLAVLGGCDGIVFGGGVGEHAPGVRARALATLEWAGIEVDAALNAAARGGSARIDPARGGTQLHVIGVDEESILARAASLCA